MIFYDFHHHKINSNHGIFNLNLFQDPIDGFFSAGVHPKDLGENLEDAFRWLQEVSQHSNCIAIGECGLDGLVPVHETLQKEAFRKQIMWANKIKKPIIIHCVKRFHELNSFRKISKTPLIIHGFNKNKRMAEELEKNGFYLSFGKAVLHNLSLQETVKHFPLNKMFVETDDSFFDIEKLYEKISEIKNISAEKLQEQIQKNLDAIIHG